MSIKVDNAIIMAAGFASRFAPLSYEYPKGLTVVKGEVLVERQIRQLLEAGIGEIILVTGYLKEKYSYLKDKYRVTLIENPQYSLRNNHSSIHAARDFLKNSYVCSSDNYFIENPFRSQEEHSFYSACYSSGPTEEWCLSTDPKGLITQVTIGGEDAWYMLGHAFWEASFSQNFLGLLEARYEDPAIRDYMWEHLYIRHISKLPLYIKKYPQGSILEFDSLEELRGFDTSYNQNSHSVILNGICGALSCTAGEICGISPIDPGTGKFSFTFRFQDCSYCYCDGRLERV